MTQALAASAAVSFTLAAGSVLSLSGRGIAQVQVSGGQERELVITGASQQLGPYRLDALVGLVGQASGLTYEVTIGYGTVGDPVSVSDISGIGVVSNAILSIGWIAAGWQWKRVAANGTVADIIGANSASYSQQAADVQPGVRIYPQPTGLTYAPYGITASDTIVGSLAISGTPPLTGTVGSSYVATFAASGGTAPYTYSAGSGSTLPPGTSLNTSTGAVTGTLTTAGSYTYLVHVTDASLGSANSATATVVVSAAGAALSISGSSPTTATVGTSYSGDFDSAGGTAPIVFSVASGTLPAGLSLNSSTGTISGTPTTVGASAGIVIRATDALGATANASAFTITVSAAGGSVTVSGSPATTGNIGNAYSATLTAAGGTGPYTYSISAGTLPAGLSINASTGGISGQPTTAGAQTGITIRAVDSLGAAGTATPFTLTIAAAMSISGTPATTGSVGTAYSFTPTVASGVGTKTFALVAGTLPAGLSLNTATGAITGTPTTVQTQTGLSLRVTDSATTPQTATLATFQIAVSGAAANTKPKFGYGLANASGDQSAFATIFAAMTDMGGAAANGGKVGTFATTSSTTNYTWLAILASAGAPTISDGTGTGNFDGALSTGIYTGLDTTPTTTYGTWTNTATGDVWRMYRGDGKASTLSTWSIS